MPARILAFAVPRGEDPRGRMAPVTASAYPYTGERDWPGDERALSRFLSGDILGFEQIVRHYSTMVFSLAARLVGPAEAEDVVQETFLRAYHGLGNFRGESSLKTWLYAIALNRARARHGTLGRLRAIFTPGRAREDDPFASLDDAADPASTPEENAVLKERRTRLRAAIRELPGGIPHGRPPARPRGSLVRRGRRGALHSDRNRAKPARARPRDPEGEALVSARPFVPRLSDEDLDLLLSRSLDGDLSPEEEHDLETLLAHDPAAARRKEELARARGRGPCPARARAALRARHARELERGREGRARRLRLPSLRFLPAARHGRRRDGPSRDRGRRDHGAEAGATARRERVEGPVDVFLTEGGERRRTPRSRPQPEAPKIASKEPARSRSAAAPAAPAPAAEAPAAVVASAPEKKSKLEGKLDDRPVDAEKVDSSEEAGRAGSPPPSSPRTRPRLRRERSRTSRRSAAEALEDRSGCRDGSAPSAGRARARSRRRRRAGSGARGPCREGLGSACERRARPRLVRRRARRRRAAVDAAPCPRGPAFGRRPLRRPRSASRSMRRDA